MPRIPSLTKRDIAGARKVATMSQASPVSTYRLQFHSGFTFAEACDLVPYLERLGVTHVYASPIWASQAGSKHGYDVVDFEEIDLEIGGREGFDRLSAELRRHGMGLIVDFVPNHMGIARGANAWWQDVLENGQASPYAQFFDIDWGPLKPEMQDQVLVPVLGDQFGEVLERGELQLEFLDGGFTVCYYDTGLPIAPTTYPMILQPAMDIARSRYDEGHMAILDLESIAGSLERLPSNRETDPEIIDSRRREQIVARHRLSQLALSEEPIRDAIQQVVDRLNGRKGRPSSFDDLEQLLNAQSYRPAFWRVAAEEINYRRFFAINDLAAIRQEIPGVFESTHRLLFQLIGEGKIAGVRIDHPDGLWDPEGYFHDLQRGAFLSLARAAIESQRGGALSDEIWTEWIPQLIDVWQSAKNDSIDSLQLLYVVVEKILEHGEQVPDGWPVSGTVGYEFARSVAGLFVDSTNRKAFDDFYARFTGRRIRFSDLVYEQKKHIMRVALASEVNVLARALDRLTEHDRRSRDYTLNNLRYAMREILACFPVYRTYTVCGQETASTLDGRAIDSAVADALRRNPASDRGVFEFIRKVLKLDFAEGSTTEQMEEQCRFVMKFQQLSGPVMAKGLEDTAFYQYNRLISLNEVGGDPTAFGTSPAEFHRDSSIRAERFPAAMLTSSTHDTKRSEDVRARISALSEMPAEWRAAVNRWARSNRRFKSRIDGAGAPDRNDEYHLYQSLVGVWPFDEAAVDDRFIERVTSYMIKVVREAQIHSSWISPNEGYEAAVAAFIGGILTPGKRNPFPGDFAAFIEPVMRIGALTGLSQQLLKLTAPGMPDIYQGTELWDFSLVDPDNRRPVDFLQRSAVLDDIDNLTRTTAGAISLLEDLGSGAIKMFVTQRGLKHRAQFPELFSDGAYLPLQTTGPLSDHLIAFARATEEQKTIVVVPRLIGRLLRGQQEAPVGALWESTHVLLEKTNAPEAYENILTGEHLTVAMNGAESVLDAAQILRSFPVAVLHRMPAPRRKTQNLKVRTDD